MRKLESTYKEDTIREHLLKEDIREHLLKEDTNREHFTKGGY